MVCVCTSTDQGECCCASTRTFVHEKVYDKFVAAAVKLAKERKVGNAFDAGVRQGGHHFGRMLQLCHMFLSTVFIAFRFGHTKGPQVDDDTFTKVLQYIEAGKKEGATLAVGGKRIGNVGFFIEPTVFTNVTDNMSIATDEVMRATSSRGFKLVCSTDPVGLSQIMGI